MDINNYSYTGPDFGVDYDNPINEYRNDDMNAILDYWYNQYNAAPNHPNNDKYIVSASSYDGSMDIWEMFTTLDAAKTLYNHIIENYKHTPPIKRELRKYINSLHRLEKGA